MRKLVLKDKDGWLTEVDQKALRREAQALKSYIDAVSESEERIYCYRTRLLPLVLQALDGTISLPHKGEPYNMRYIMEGIEPELPAAIRSAYYEFLVRIHGNTSISSTSIKDHGEYVPGASEVIIDGQRYEWVDFED